MIKLLAVKYQRPVAYILLSVFYLSILVPAYAINNSAPVLNRSAGYRSLGYISSSPRLITNPFKNNLSVSKKNNNKVIEKKNNGKDEIKKTFIDGPTQPEMSRFTPAGSTNLVNLFTGDFSYNIPLLDVGGYPVNIFYDGGITPEQEASWVGLGWNINPGTISRNIRGVPDDFDGTDKLITTQMMKPNITWGGRLGADFEISGVKTNLPFDISVGASLGLSVNNYLGPALEAGIKGGLSFKVASLASTEKQTDSSVSTLRIGVGANANLSSRGGLTLSPYASLSANKLIKDHFAVGGNLGISTSYNSRAGIDNLNISGQFRFSEYQIKRQSLKTREAVELGNSHSMNASIVSSSISFSKPSYIPSLRMPVTNEAYSGHFQLGGALWGLYASGEVEVYKQTSTVEPADRIQTKPMVGYLYYQNANNNRDAVVDFTRFNDKEVTDKTPIISAPQYSYDVFSINGEGTGGSIRLYRNDYGAVRDNYTKSQDKSLSVGVDIGIPGHFGANVNMIKTPSTIGEWQKDNKLKTTSAFKEASADNENVYFRNPGETSVLNNDQYNKIGGTDLVRYKLGGSKMNPTLEPVLERFAPDGKKLTDLNQVSTPGPAARNKRTQVVSYLTAQEASQIGLDNQIKCYHFSNPLDGSNSLAFDAFNRVEGYRRPNHISQINVTEADGKRYIYGLPVYNIVQKDYTFTTDAATTPDDDLVYFDPNEKGTNSPLLDKSSKKDGYLQVNTTPAYAHSFLLTGLLSPDYVDVTGNGITEDDLGTAVKFNYGRTKDIYESEWSVHKWRTPLSTADHMAHFNAGTLTNNKDDKANMSYGERESWYLHSIESKTMIALFTLAERNDGKGPYWNEDEHATNNDISVKRLARIDLYNKADLKKNGIAGAKPIKTVHFDYAYTLCPTTPDNPSNGGKLTLTRIYFTFNGHDRINASQYKFVYASGTGNPAYNYNTSDRWGNYKPASLNPGQLKNKDYPYSYQPTNASEKQTQNEYAAAWSLKKILLPAGGQIEVEYESDDYAFVQNRRAATMMSIAGFGKNNTTFTNQLYSAKTSGFDENNYVLINVPVGCSTKQEVYLRYIQGQEQLAFRLAVQMPKGIEYMTSYGVIEDYDVYGTATDKKIWVKLSLVDNLNPLSITALEFLKEQLPGQAFPGYDVSEGTGMEKFAGMLEGMLMGLKNAFKDPIKAMRIANKARYTDVSKCFVRLNDPDGFKYGGGHRVKKVVLKDNWHAMTQQYTSQYGTEYDYTTTEIFNGQPRTISSGVASYEPSIGGEENPFQTMVQIRNKLPLGPASYNAIEMPVLDAFFPAPIVGYSKVTVRTLSKGDIPQGYKSRSGIGRQVTEFYTAKDFPVYYSNTVIDPESDKQEHKNSFGAFFWKWAFDSRAISQGFIVAANDMHGKMKSQSSYAENDTNTRISYTENFYRNTGTKGMNEKFDFIYAAEGGKVRAGNMGIDIELMTDTREFSVKSTSKEIQSQLDYFPTLIPGVAWIPFIWPVQTKSENTYRAVTCTKVINYHSIIDSIIVIDKSSQVSTKNLVYDAETGDVIVNRTNNEFDKPVYSINYPAYWAYSGMGLAYKNIDAVYSNIDFYDGRITNAGFDQSIFESGDELYIIYAGNGTGCDPIMASDAAEKLVWALDLDKNTSSLTNGTPDYIFIDKAGKPYSRTGVKFRIVRSGKRNILTAPVASVTQMADPIVNVFLERKLIINSASKVINASAGEFKEKWQVDNDVFRKYRTIQITNSPSELLVNGNFSSGNSGFSTEYTYYPFVYSTGHEGNYHVTTNPHNWHTGLAACTDHTTGSGNMMIINGATQSNKIVWSQTVAVQPNINYTFSVWSASADPESPANLQVNINNTQLGNTLQLSSTVCVWNNFQGSWNSGSANNAVITIVDLNSTGGGNDFILDDISFQEQQYCTTQEVEDCTGYLEKKVNPYRKGLLGTFRGYENLVFYGERMENDPLLATNLPVNGYLNGFGPYWHFSIGNQLIPNTSNPNWKSNNQSTTRFNAKGMELENKDALNIYSSAQYGYLKTIPVAVASNSRYEEMMNESFEDYDYSETLNNASYNTCGIKHIDFNGLANATILNTSNTPFNAHTGKHVMQVAAGSTVTKQISVTPPAVEDYSLTMQNDITQTLYEQGGNYQYTFANPSNVFDDPSNAFIFQGNSPRANIRIQPVDNLSGGNRFHYYSTTWDFYIQITDARTYDFSTGLSTAYNNDGAIVNTHSNAIAVIITDLQGNQVNSHTLGQNGFNPANDSYSVFLCAGIYKVQGYITELYSATNNGMNYTVNNYSWQCNNTSLVYKSLSTQNGCSYTKPLPADLTMQNPVFSIPQNKQMLFSAWVREECGNPQGGIPCTLNTYTNNQVTLQFDAGGSQPVTMNPSGPIIEGWQRYEAYFTAPSGSTQMTIGFVNNSGQPVYFDDIRIHPFNANMKSYVYDPVSLRLLSELDANNYASFYEYDEEGTLIRTKAETKQGIKTIKESRSAKQKSITEIQ